jgi:hypothetical protein
MAHLSIRALGSLLGRTVPVVLRGRVEDVEEHAAAGPDLEYASRVPASIAVVRCRPHRRQVLLKQGRVALHAELVGSEDVRHLVDLEELVDDSRAKGVTCSSVVVIASIRNEPVRKPFDRAVRKWHGTNRGEIAKSSFSGSGSDHTRSAIGPSWGISEHDNRGRKDQENSLLVGMWMRQSV